jgi:hypothetical protein
MENIKIQENDLSQEIPTNDTITDETLNETEITDGTYPEFDTSKLTDEEKERIDEINDLLKTETLDPTTAMNILINAVQVSYDKEHFNDLDRYLIIKALTTFKNIADTQEDIIIKTV